MKATDFISRGQASLLTSVLLGAATSLAGADFENNLEKTFQVSPGGKLVLQADRGTCEVTPSATDKVQVRVLRQVKRGNKSQADDLFANHEVTLTQEGGTVRVVAKTKQNPSFSGKPNSPYLEVRYEISVPKKFDLDLRTSGGDIRIGELDGRVKARTSSGGIQLQRATGNVEAANAGGDVVVGETDGDLSAQTSSGSIRVQRVGGKAELSNAGGDIRVGDAQKGVVAKTSSGRIEIKSVKGDLEINNSGGDISAGTVGGGVTATTSSGSINLGQILGKSVNVKNAGGDIRIEAAAGSVMAKTSSGLLNIKTAQGTIEARNSGGDINIGEAGGQITANTSSGSIRVKLARGKLDARNSGGDINVEQAHGAVQASTSSGVIAAGLVAQPSEESRLEVSGGEIKLTLAKWVDLDLDAKSSGGTVRSELPVTETVTGGRKQGVLQGRLNRGGPKLVLRSSSGDIQLKASRAPRPKAEAETGTN